MNHYLSLFIAIALTAAGQVLMKSGVMRGNSWLSGVVQLQTITGYGIFFVATLFGVYALQAVPLKVFIAFTATSYVIVTVLSRVVLQELVSGRRWMSCCMISAGVLVFSL